MTESHIGDTPVFTDLSSLIPADEEIASVTAYSPYDNLKRHNVNAVRTPSSRLGGMQSLGRPLPPVLPREMESNGLGRALWQRWSK